MPVRALGVHSRVCAQEESTRKTSVGTRPTGGSDADLFLVSVPWGPSQVVQPCHQAPCLWSHPVDWPRCLLWAVSLRQHCSCLAWALQASLWPPECTHWEEPDAAAAQHLEQGPGSQTDAAHSSHTEQAAGSRQAWGLQA